MLQKWESAYLKALSKALPPSPRKRIINKLATVWQIGDQSSPACSSQVPNKKLCTTPRKSSRTRRPCLRVQHLEPHRETGKAEVSSSSIFYSKIALRSSGFIEAQDCQTRHRGIHPCLTSKRDRWDCKTRFANTRTKPHVIPRFLTKVRLGFLGFKESLSARALSQHKR